ncbi:MAG TPA: hypothetical protein VMN37_02485 [Gemmatimonadales bacterium]|nr:hypothetical protein [Gemmatimonadales bacterium]
MRLRRDLTDDPYHGTVLGQEPAGYHVRWGDRRWRLVPRSVSWWELRERAMRAQAGGWGTIRAGGLLLVFGEWATDCTLMLPGLILRTWTVERRTAEAVAEAVAAWHWEDAVHWAEAQGLVGCSACREPIRGACPGPGHPACGRPA